MSSKTQYQEKIVSLPVCPQFCALGEVNPVMMGSEGENELVSSLFPSLSSKEDDDNATGLIDMAKVIHMPVIGLEFKVSILARLEMLLGAYKSYLMLYYSTGLGHYLKSSNEALIAYRIELNNKAMLAA